jgi:predicted nucleic acid-binding protein
MALIRLRPFLDTNVIFSGLYSPFGPPAAILERHAQGFIRFVISSQVIDELVRTIRAKRPDLLALLHEFLMAAPPEIVADPPIEAVRRMMDCINAADAPILAAAIRSESDCLVTGNSRHFTPEVARCAGFRILSPAAYLAGIDAT